MNVNGSQGEAEGKRGSAAATWVFDRNTTEETYRAVARMLAEGDPEIYDTYRVPDLSGNSRAIIQ